MRDRNPANPDNWKIVCSACGTEWANDETIELVGGHWEKEHPELEKPHLNTIWIGIGPAPKKGARGWTYGKPSNRATKPKAKGRHKRKRRR
jgi:hypothetical protein